MEHILVQVSKNLQFWKLPKTKSLNLQWWQFSI
jgi:hypothetical protein